MPRLIIIIIVFMKRNSFCASSFFCFPSVNGPHCITLLAMATLKLPVFWSSRKLTSLRGTGASALPPLTIFHSLSALQRWPHCTPMRHQLQPSRRHCIPAQHRRAGMTRPPALPPRLLRASCRQMWQLTENVEGAQEQRKVENIEVKSSMKCQTGR